MIKRTLFRSALTVTAISLLVSSCKKDVVDNTAPPVANSAAYVVNEGSFGSGNSSITMINLQNNQIYQDVFQTTNGFPLGDLAQSMTIAGDKGYIVVNVSKKVEVVNATTLQSIATITGFDGPRYFISNGNKGYVTDWFSNSVAVIDLSTNTITNSIVTGEGPEQMALVGNRLFVTNVGGWGSDSTITIINVDSETPETTLTVGLNPNSLQVDAAGKLWVLCGGTTGPDFIGGTSDDIAGSLVRINPSNLNIELSLTMNQEHHPSKMQINGAKLELYYLLGSDGYTGAVAKMSTLAATLPAGVSINKNFYGLGIDPQTGNIYGGYSPGFSSNGYVFRYQPGFNLIDSIPAGIAPSGFCFR